MSTNESGPIDWAALRESIYRYLRSRGPSRELAEDLAHDSLIKVSSNLGRLTDQSKLTSWALTIARNVTNDYYRKTKHQDAELEGDEPYTPQSENLNSFIAAWLPEAIQDLPSLDRKLIEGVDINGRTLKSVAPELDLSYTAAKSRIQRARRKVKDAIFECCRLEFDPRGNIIDYTRREKEDCDCEEC